MNKLFNNKKITVKKILMICIIVFGVGALLFLVGYFIEGSIPTSFGIQNGRFVYTTENDNVGIAGPSNISASSGTPTSSINTAYKTIYEDLDSFSNIKLNSNSSDIYLVAADKNAIEIKYVPEQIETDFKVENGTLTYTDKLLKQMKSKFNGTENNYKINVVTIYYKSETVFDDIYIETLGDTHAENIKVNKATFESTFGDCTLLKSDIKELVVSLTCGDIDISDAKAETIRLNNTFGYVNANNIEVKNSFDTYISSGDVDITKITSPSSYIEVSFGDTQINDCNIDSINIESSSGDITLNGNCKDINIENSFGDVNLSVDAPKADYKLDLETSFGEIYVNRDKVKSSYMKENGSKEITVNCSSGDINLAFSN